MQRHFPKVGVVFDFEQSIDVVDGSHVRGDCPAVTVGQQGMRENGTGDDVRDDRMRTLCDGHHDARVRVGGMFAADATEAGRQNSITALNFRGLSFQPTGFYHDGVDQAAIEKRDDFTVVGSLRKNCLSKEVFWVFTELGDLCQADAIGHEGRSEGRPDGISLQVIEFVEALVFGAHEECECRGVVRIRLTIGNQRSHGCGTVLRHSPVIAGTRDEGVDAPLADAFRKCA